MRKLLVVHNAMLKMSKMMKEATGRQTDMDRPVRCALLILKSKKHLISLMSDMRTQLSEMLLIFL